MKHCTQIHAVYNWNIRHLTFWFAMNMCGSLGKPIGVNVVHILKINKNDEKCGFNQI